MVKLRRVAVLVLCGLFAAGMFASAAAVTLPGVIGEHMVVQQGKDIPVWGKAEPGEKVTVKLGRKKASAVAGDDGRWMVRLPAMKAEKPSLTLCGARSWPEICPWRMQGSA